MIGSIGYGLLALVMGAILTGVVSLFRPIRVQDEWKPWKWILSLGFLAGASPYIAAEFMTRMFGKDMGEAVADMTAQAEIAGKPDYYKVIWLKGDQARLVVGYDEMNEWGTRERTIVATSLTRENGKWRAADYNVVTSYQRNKDHCTFPPYW
jgi:hypothetical protein